MLDFCWSGKSWAVSSGLPRRSASGFQAPPLLRAVCLLQPCELFSAAAPVTDQQGEINVMLMRKLCSTRTQSDNQRLYKVDLDPQSLLSYIDTVLLVLHSCITPNSKQQAGKNEASAKNPIIEVGYKNNSVHRLQL